MPGLAERALRIIRKRYDDFGPTLACEKLAGKHNSFFYFCRRDITQPLRIFMKGDHSITSIEIG